MRLEGVMTRPVVTVRASSTLEEAARLMMDRRVGGLPVVDDEGALVGFLTESDFTGEQHGVPFGFVRFPQVLGAWLGKEGIERIYAQARERLVSDVMSAPTITVGEDATVEDVVRLMVKNDVNRIVVEREGRPVGIVARHDLLRIFLVEPSR